MKNIDHILEEAMDYYRAEELDQAKKLYDSILEQEPDNQEALDWRGEIAIQQEEYETAAQCLQRSKKLYPDEFEENCKLGLAYYELSEAENAVDVLYEAILLDGEDLVSHSNLGKALYDLYNAGKIDKAQRIAKDWVRRFPDQPDAAHMGVAVAGQKAPERANDAYVADVFNDFAVDFEDKLEELGYQAPQLLIESLATQTHLFQETINILDAGCGTGLCGPYLRPWAKNLVGVDLSPGMLEKAAERNLYDQLQEAELTAFLVEHKNSYELIIAADVLCYFGELGPVLTAAKHSLTQNGIVAFSVESKPDINQYLLHPSGRYTHEKAYVEAMIKAAGLELCGIQDAVLRWEYGEEVYGIIVVAKNS